MTDTTSNGPAAGDNAENGGANSPATETAAPAAAATDDDNPWAKHGALIVAGAPGKMPTKGSRKVIVAENRLQVPEKDVPADFTSQDDKATYPKGGDVYYGYARVVDPNAPDAEANRIFGDSAAEAEVVLMGDTVRQFSHEGLSRKPGSLSVGPGHPVYGAVNIAWQRGARDVKVVGLRDDEIKALRPWFDQIAPEFEKLDYAG